MAKAAARGNKPVYNVRARQDPDNDFMVTIGAVWPFENGDGFVVRLHILPIQWDGSMILVKPKESDE
jgi:hypothetical protein